MDTTETFSFSPAQAITLAVAGSICGLAALPLIFF